MKISLSGELTKTTNEAVLTTHIKGSDLVRLTSRAGQPSVRVRKKELSILAGNILFATPLLGPVVLVYEGDVKFDAKKKNFSKINIDISKQHLRVESGELVLACLDEIRMQNESSLNMLTIVCCIRIRNKPDTLTWSDGGISDYGKSYSGQAFEAIRQNKVSGLIAFDNGFVSQSKKEILARPHLDGLAAILETRIDLIQFLETYLIQRPELQQLLVADSGTISQLKRTFLSTQANFILAFAHGLVSLDEPSHEEKLWAGLANLDLRRIADEGANPIWLGTALDANGAVIFGDGQLKCITKQILNLICHESNTINQTKEKL